MNRTVRQVELFRLKSPHRRYVARTVHALEDALRIASFPDGDGRLILIRSLQLGRIGASLSSAALSRVIEEAVRRTGFRAVHALSAAAEEAAAAYFESSLEALTQAAIQVAQGAALRQWFWPRAIRGITPETPPADAFVLILREALASAPGTAAAALVLRRLIQQGLAERILLQLAAKHGEQLLQEFGWRRVVSTLTGGSSSSSPPSIAAPWLALLRELIPVWTAADPRSQWLVTLAIVADTRAESPLRALPQLANEVAARIAESAGAIGKAAPDVAGRRNDQRSASIEMPLETLAGSGKERRTEPAVAAGADVTATPEPGKDVTAFGGLFFVVPILRRLNIPSMAPEGFAQEFLLDLARRLRIPEDDPILAELVLREEPRCSPGELRRWRNAVRLWTRRNLRFGLHALVCRRATVAHQPLYLDITFPFSDVDIRIRKLALDSDPGWVPWLGLVIHFHYREMSS